MVGAKVLVHDKEVRAGVLKEEQCSTKRKKEN